ncbi:MAG: hypothetical protein NW224_06300 [Leptolyngbyaceae cyanobacterium bins.302]|nr:hypothetical protein [Leptolyngbyaceae cyanobacterium bins.302]
MTQIGVTQALCDRPGRSKKPPLGVTGAKEGRYRFMAEPGS